MILQFCWFLCNLNSKVPRKRWVFFHEQMSIFETGDASFWGFMTNGCPRCRRHFFSTFCVNKVDKKLTHLVNFLKKLVFSFAMSHEVHIAEVVVVVRLSVLEVSESAVPRPRGAVHSVSLAVWTHDKRALVIVVKSIVVANIWEKESFSARKLSQSSRTYFVVALSGHVWKKIHPNFFTFPFFFFFFFLLFWHSWLFCDILSTFRFWSIFFTPDSGQFFFTPGCGCSCQPF